MPDYFNDVTLTEEAAVAFAETQTDDDLFDGYGDLLQAA